MVLTPEIDRLGQFGVGLGDAGEDDLGRDEAGAQRDVDLAARIGVDARAEAAQQADDRQRRVGLERVMERVRVARERLVDGAVTRGDRGAAVDVERRAVGGRELGQRHAVAVSSPCCRGNADTMKGNCTASRRAVGGVTCGRYLISSEGILAVSDHLMMHAR